MATANFQTALRFVLQQEGGWSDRSDDTPTNQGITLATWRAATCRPSATADDLRAMTAAQRDTLYRDMYWAPIAGDDLPSGVDLAVFDFAVNAGPRTAVRMLQTLLDVAGDGIVGPATLGDVRASCADRDDAAALIRSFTEDRIAYYQSLNKPEFIAGWTNRANACEAAALALVLA